MARCWTTTPTTRTTLVAAARRWYASGRPYRQIDQVDGTPNPWLQRWLDHPSYDAYWQAMVPYGDQFNDIRIPVLTITGYYDDGQISALQYFRTTCGTAPMPTMPC
jgi:predicted acyl esterase